MGTASRERGRRRLLRHEPGQRGPPGASVRVSARTVRPATRAGVAARPRRLALMPQSLVEGRLSQVSGRLQQLRAELEVSGEQLAHLADAADDARLRAL